MMQPFLVYLLMLNTLTFLANGIDKWLAKNQKSRISEKMLLGLVALGGTIGAGIGMLLFRHKTAKRSYLLQFFGIVLLQLLVVYFYVRS